MKKQMLYDKRKNRLTLVLLNSSHYKLSKADDFLQDVVLERPCLQQ